MHFRPCATCSKPVTQTLYGWVHVTPAADLHPAKPKGIIRTLLEKAEEIVLHHQQYVCKHDPDVVFRVRGLNGELNESICLDCGGQWTTQDDGTIEIKNEPRPFEIQDPFADMPFGSYLTPYSQMEDLL